MIRKLYNWVLHWAETRYAMPALILVAFTESSFFPIPPDPLLMALCLGNPKRSLMYAAVCSLASVGGGLFGYYIGWGIWEIVDDFFLTFVFSSDAFLYVSQEYEQNAFLAILGAAFTPIPYKVFTVTAGVFKIDFFTFILASIVGRSARFFIEGGLIYFFGVSIKTFIDKYFNILVTLFFILLVLGFLVVRYWIK